MLAGESTLAGELTLAGDGALGALGSEAGLAGLGSETGLGTEADAGDALTGEALTGDGVSGDAGLTGEGLTMLSLETENVTSAFSTPFVSLAVVRPKAWPAKVLRGIAWAAETAPPASIPRPSAEVAPTAIQFLAVIFVAMMFSRVQWRPAEVVDRDMTTVRALHETTRRSG